MKLELKPWSVNTGETGRLSGPRSSEKEFSEGLAWEGAVAWAWGCRTGSVPTRHPLLPQQTCLGLLSASAARDGGGLGWGWGAEVYQ